MIYVKVLKSAKELQTFLNIVGWKKVLKVLPSEYYVQEPGDARQVGAIRVRGPEEIVRESTYTVIFEDDIDHDELMDDPEDVSKMFMNCEKLEPIPNEAKKCKE